jgi:pimeloyl-ACP methyl ester carboxylesterase
MKLLKAILYLVNAGLLLAGFVAEAAEPKELHISSAGHQIFVKDYPGAEPAFVMVHGFPDNHHIYDELAPILSQRGHRVITFDFLGFGDSEEADSIKYSFEQQEEDLAAVADALSLRTFTPVAHDAGGPAVINYARLHPERISSIVLLNTYYSKTATLKLPPLIEFYADPRLKRLAVAMMNDPEQRHWLLNFQANLFLENATPEIKQKFKRVLLPIIIENFDSKPGAGAAYIAMTSDMYRNVEENTRTAAELAKIESPVRVIWGGGDPYLDVGVAQDLARQFKHSEVHILPLGHWPQIDDPKTVADLMAPGNI